MYKYNCKTDQNGFTHIFWTLEGVTAKMLDWHWSNLDKTYTLWHPVDHEGFAWAVSVTPERFIGAVHKTLQGERAKIYSDPMDSPVGLQYLDPALFPPELAKLIVHDHAVIVGPIRTEDIGKPQSFDFTLSFRLHQWSSCSEGVHGISSAITPSPKNPEEETHRTAAWLPHAQGECGYWENFLPQMYSLWRVVKHEKLNPFHDLTIQHLPNGCVKYLHI